MAFGIAQVITNTMRAMLADRIRTTPGVYAASPRYLAVGSGATAAARTAAVTDVALSAEAEARVLAAESLVTTSVSNDTYQVQGTVTMTGNRSIDEFATFDQLALGGNMGVSATGVSPTVGHMDLKAGDTLTYTIQVQIR